MKKFLTRLSIIFLMCFTVATATNVMAADQGKICTAYASASSNSTGYASATTNISATNKAALKKALVAGWKNFSGSINVTSYGVTVKEISLLYFETLFENPDIFYVKSNMNYNYQGTTVVSIQPVYTFSKSTISTYTKKYEDEISKLISGITSSMSDLEKVLYVKEYLDTNCSYGEPDDTYAHCSYGAFVNKTPVCQGYALAFKSILDRLGIECHYVDSESLNHAWNLVKLNGTYFYIDSTWDDPIPDKVGRSGHKYFLLSKSELSSRNHNTSDWLVRADGVTASVVTSNKYNNYFWNNTNCPFYYYNGYWYGFDGNGNLNKYSCDGRDFTKISTIDTISNVYNGTALWAGVLYYSDYYGLYYYDLEKGTKGSLGNYSGIQGIFINRDGKATCVQNGSNYSFRNILYRTSLDISSYTMNFISGSNVLTPDKTLSYNFDGNDKKPKMSIVIGGRTLVEGVDYTLSYKNNKYCGNATVTATGKGEYSGTISRNFTIAAKGKCGTNATWEFNSEKGILTINGTGAMADYSKPEYAPWYQFGKKIISVYIGNGVTAIGNNAFTANDELLSVTGCNGIKSIGKNAFKNCFALKRVEGCGSLDKVLEMAFHNCYKLSQIGSTANTYNLTNASVIGPNAFFCCKVVQYVKTGTKLTAIGSGAFRNCYNLLNISVGNNCIRFGECAFSGDGRLTTISGATGIQTVGKYAFNNCEVLRTVGTEANKVRFPGVSTICTFAFNGCRAMDYFVAGQYLETVGSCAFNVTPALKTVYLKTTKLKTVGTNAFAKIAQNAKIYVPSAKLSEYKTLITQKGLATGSTFVKI